MKGIRFFKQFFVFLLSCLALLAQNEGEANRERIRVSLNKLRASDRLLEDFLYERNVVRKEFDSQGNLRQSSEVRLRRDPWDEFGVNRIIAKDGKALSAAEQAKQEEKLRRYVIDAHKKKPTNVIAEEQDAWFQEVADAMEFQKVGSEIRDGRKLDEFRFEPKPGYKANSSRARAFEKVRGRVWLDELTNEMAKIDAEVFDTVSVGFGVLGRIEKGTHFEFERRIANGDYWFTTWQKVRFGVKVLMVKSLRQEIETRSWNFQPHPKLLAK